MRERHILFKGIMSVRATRFLVPLLLGILLGAGGYWLYTGGPRSHRIREQFHDQMLAHLPKTYTFDGKPHTLQGLKITNVREGAKGCTIEYEILWSDDAVTVTSAPLEINDLGGYRCEVHSLIFQQPISFEIAG